MSVADPWQAQPMLEVDIDAVAALAADEPAAPHWPVHEYARMLAVIAESPARRGAWVLVASGDAPGPFLGGFCMASQVAGVCELEAVVIRADLRGARLGETLVRVVAAWGRAQGAYRLQLEARMSNLPALRLYERMGFIRDGARPAYYHNPEEDAMLMSLSLRP